MDDLSWGFVIGAGEVLGFLLIPVLVHKRKPAVSTIAWILAFVFLPLLGPLFYLLFGDTRMERRLRRRKNAAKRLFQGSTREEHLSSPLPAPFPSMSDFAEGVARVALEAGAMPLTWNNEVSLLVDGSQKFPALMDAIRGARDHIHVLYYIFETDETGVQIRDLLAEKAREGVEVRLLWDIVGSYGALTGFFDPLEEAGGKVTSFMPARLLKKRFELNFRNHRKIVVVDGERGFVGGMNIGNEYSGAKGEAWHDLHLQIEGEAALHLQDVFAEDWFFSTRENLSSARYFTRPPERPGDLVQIAASGPDHEWPILHKVFFTAISTALRKVFLITPYFVPTESLVSALCATAQRGVEVKLILPSRSDQPLVFHAGRSYYRELLSAGVQIFEFEQGLLHGKAMVVDGEFATVGSCNVDVRSFQLNFEVNALVYSRSFARGLEEVFLADLKKSREVTPETFAERPLHVRVFENSCRLLSPLL